MKSKKKRIFKSVHDYDVTIRELYDGRMMEIPKAYVDFQIFRESEFLSFRTRYQCPFCAHKGKNVEVKKKKIKDKTVFTACCENCKKLIICEEFGKGELID